MLTPEQIKAVLAEEYVRLPAGTVGGDWQRERAAHVAEKIAALLPEVTETVERERDEWKRQSEKWQAAAEENAERWVGELTRRPKHRCMKTADYCTACREPWPCSLSEATS